MFILPVMKDHLSWETTKFSGHFRQVSQWKPWYLIRCWWSVRLAFPQDGGGISDGDGHFGAATVSCDYSIKYAFDILQSSSPKYSQYTLKTMIKVTAQIAKIFVLTSISLDMSDWCLIDINQRVCYHVLTCSELTFWTLWFNTFKHILNVLKMSQTLLECSESFGWKCVKSMLIWYNFSSVNTP